MDQFPPATIAAEAYSQDVGGNIKAQSEFAADPFVSAANREDRQKRFSDEYPDMYEMMNAVVNGQYDLFECGLMRLIELVKEI